MHYLKSQQRYCGHVIKWHHYIIVTNILYDIGSIMTYKTPFNTYTILYESVTLFLVTLIIICEQLRGTPLILKKSISPLSLHIPLHNLFHSPAVNYKNTRTVIKPKSITFLRVVLITGYSITYYFITINTLQEQFYVASTYPRCYPCPIISAKELIFGRYS